MPRWLPQLIALTLVLGSGAVHGIWSGRWSPSRVLETRAAELKCVPSVVGDWKGTDMELDARTLQVARLAGYVMRRYQNPKGDVVTAMLVCGLPGPVAVHTPEICYPGNGFEQVADAVKQPVAPGESGHDEFWSVDFHKAGPAVPEDLRVLYSWNAGKSWSTSENPRLEFAGEPALFKLYVVRIKGAAARPEGDDPGVDFLRQFLPVLRGCLFASRP
jgi:hypothetical protein